MSKHTELPWKLCKDGKNIYCEEKDICITNCNHPDFEEAKANYEFIVTACNSHYELLETCKEVLRALTSPSRQILDSTRKEMEPLIPLLISSIEKGTFND